jgi:hypothetical protein
MPFESMWLSLAMNIVKHAWLVYLGLAGLAIVAVVVGESFKLAWVGDWLAPILTLLCFVSHSTLAHRPDSSARTRAGMLASYAKVTAFALLIYLFIMIELVTDTPVTLRLMGFSMTMSGQSAARFLAIGGLIIGGLGVWLNTSQLRRETEAAARAMNASGQTPPSPTVPSKSM